VNAPAVSVPVTVVRRDPKIRVLIVACAAVAAQLLVLGLLVTGRPPGLLAFVAATLVLQFASVVAIRRYAGRTREGVTEVQRAVEELRVANDELQVRNGDLHALLQFANGLASRSHDRGEVVSYARAALARVTGVQVAVHDASAAGGIELVAGGRTVGKLDVELGGALDEARWRRLRELIVPQLASALESAELVEQGRRTHKATIAALSKSMEAKDFYTGGHTERVAEVAVALAQRLGFHGTELEAVEVGALLHDIGKIGIPERILQKPGPLDDEEWAIMKTHTIEGQRMLDQVGGLLGSVGVVVRASHEHFDGRGYPDGLAGEDIPLAARIVTACDSFNAMTTTRSYRKAMPLSAAVAEMRRCAATQFDPDVVDALLAVVGDPGWQLTLREPAAVLAPAAV
jgi:putative nucleotidyltransferase with HDIG domain